ncbi:unnamed protein product [Meganyctiphanes norvegica]|uniref:Uncharacterized protein n=1 Tax=Meganyctiphanes norvegica TaxID=48144 RepID=A0AAV2RGY3_MEGNR
MAYMVSSSYASSLESIREEVDDGCNVDANLVTDKLQSVLQRGVERYLTCEKVRLQRSTLLRAAHDVLRLASAHPSGLRGTLVELYLSNGHNAKRLAQVVADPNTKAVTLIKLILHQDKDTSPTTLCLGAGYTMERCCMP